jgi:hypothetical protein
MPRKNHESGSKKAREAAQREKKLAKLAKKRARCGIATVHMADNGGS